MTRTVLVTGRIPARNRSTPIVVPCCQCGQPQPLRWEPLDRATVWCDDCLGTSGSPFTGEV